MRAAQLSRGRNRRGSEFGSAKHGGRVCIKYTYVIINMIKIKLRGFYWPGYFFFVARGAGNILSKACTPDPDPAKTPR